MHHLLLLLLKQRSTDAMAMDDPDILLDLRKQKGDVHSSKYDMFWNVLSVYIEEVNPAVDERRHSNVAHMPVAISLRHLRDTIKERLEQKYPGDEEKQRCPSLEWLCLQFWPRNPFSTAALRHTGQFDLKFGVQIRQLRRSHPDSRYVSVILKYIKEFSVRFRHLVMYTSVDDKAIIPVGEPGLPISTGVRGHNRSILPLQASQGPMALDHDFHVHGVVPSVFFCGNTWVI